MIRGYGISASSVALAARRQQGWPRQTRSSGLSVTPDTRGNRTVVMQSDGTFMRQMTVSV